MLKKKSFTREILIYLIISTGLLIIIFGAFLGSSYYILENEIKDSSNAFLNIYSNEFNNDIFDLDNDLTNITMESEDLAKLKSSNENERTLSSISLYYDLQNIISENNVADQLVIYDGDYNICLDAVKTGIGYDEKNELRDFTCMSVQKGQIHSFQWYFVTIDHETFMYKMLITENRAIAIYVRANGLLNSLSTKDNGNRSIVLVNDSGTIEKIWGSKTKDIYTGANIKNINNYNYYEINKKVGEGQLAIYCFTRKNNILQQVHTSMFVVAITVCIAVFFMLFILRFTRKEIAYPMAHMVTDLEKIKEGEYNNRISGDYHTREFQMLQETTNEMVDKIVGLKIQAYEKQIQLKDMELRSIRLQLKPHFFLNALTTISSLSSQNKNTQIKMYIDALSKNVRYMFHSGFHTVPIKEEVKHIENYFEMQELKYPGCIFYLIDLPQELEEWKIPQMLIHTFIENEYKYAVSFDEVLNILIKVSRQVYKGEETLLIEIEDSGQGYPKEVLDYMNGFTKKTSKNGTRIGLWSIKRMMELMYERNDLITLENIKPHGCLNRIYVPKHAKNELAEETIG